MLTTKEAQLGSLMARIAALGTIVSFAIIALLVGPDQVGYNEQYGGILNIIGFVQSFALLFTCLLYTSPSPRDKRQSRMPSSA